LTHTGFNGQNHSWFYRPYFLVKIQLYLPGVPTTHAVFLNLMHKVLLPSELYHSLSNTHCIQLGHLHKESIWNFAQININCKIVVSISMYDKQYWQGSQMTLGRSHCQLRSSPHRSFLCSQSNYTTAACSSNRKYMGIESSVL
jgi:hypothetical protein